jgi:hypothetical protein
MKLAVFYEDDIYETVGVCEADTDAYESGKKIPVKVYYPWGTV